MNVARIKSTIASIEAIEKYKDVLHSLRTKVSEPTYSGETKHILSALMSVVSWDTVDFGKYFVPKDLLISLVCKADDRMEHAKAQAMKELEGFVAEGVFVDQVTENGS